MSKKQNLETATWRAEALRLHVEGWTFSQIARQLGKPASTVREGIDAELVDVTAGYTDQIKQRREVKSAQLEAIIRGHLPAATGTVSDENEDGATAKPDANAAFVVIACVNAQAKLHGLTAAEKVDINAAITLGFDAHTELLSRLEKIARPKSGDPK